MPEMQWVRLLYSLDEKMAAAKIALLSVSVNAVLNVILVRSMGVAGVALATSICSVGQAVLLALKARSHVRIGMRNLAWKFAKFLSHSLAMGVVVYFLLQLLGRGEAAGLTEEAVRLFVPVGAGLAFYLLLGIAFRCEETKTILKCGKERAH